MRRFAVVLLAASCLPSCGTYRSNIGEYRGIGVYRTPSEYSPRHVDPYAVTDSISAEDQKGSRDRLSGPYAYPTHDGFFKLDWPVGTVHINRGFHSSRGRTHEGLDLGGAKNSPIFAAHSGVVIYTGSGYRGYGNMVLIEFDKEWATLYGHLSKILVHEGQTVALGSPIGVMGKTGHATGIHLHFELLHNQIPVDPLPLLTAPHPLANKAKSQHRASL